MSSSVSRGLSTDRRAFLRPAAFLTTPRRLPGFKVRLRPSVPLATFLRLLALLVFLSLCIVVFFTIERPIRMGHSDLRLGADSLAYYNFTDLLKDHGSADFALVSFSGNLLGPIILALLFKTPFLIMICNIGLFLLAIEACAPVEGLSRSTLALLLAINATTLVSLVTLNKEIFALTSGLLLCRYIYKNSHSWLLLGLILLIGLMARWQQCVITLLFLFLWREGSFFRRHPSVAILLLVGAITVAYPLALHSTVVDLSWSTDQAQTGNAILVLNRLQASYGFPLTVIPKAMMSLFNRTLTPTYLFTEDPNDLANKYVIHLHCLAMAVLFPMALVKGRLRLKRPLAFFIALYVVITSANAFIQPRYQYLVYVLLCFDLARREPIASPSLLAPAQRKLLPRSIGRRSEVEV